MDVPERDIAGMGYYKFPADVFDACFRGARTRAAAARRALAVLEYAFTGTAELPQNCCDSAAFLLQFCSRIDRARACAAAAVKRSKTKRLPAETGAAETYDLHRPEGRDLRTDRELEIRDREILTTNENVSRGDCPVRENPPEAGDVTAYARASGLTSFSGQDGEREAERFIAYNEARGWVTDGDEDVTDWRGLAVLWDAASRARRRRRTRGATVQGGDAGERDEYSRL